MKIPELEQPDKYVGLYIFDFGDDTGVGFTAEEVAELLESEKYKAGKVYKIHNAYPDGRLEIKAVPVQRFHLEAGMFFYSANEGTARGDFERLARLGEKYLPPCRAKLHLAEHEDRFYVVALIYPAEYDEEVSRWLLDNKYKTAGPAQGGTKAVEEYYRQGPKILKRQQLFSKSAYRHRTGTELTAGLKQAVQR